MGTRRVTRLQFSPILVFEIRTNAVSSSGCTFYISRKYDLFRNHALISRQRRLYIMALQKSHGLPVYKCRIASRSLGIIACDESCCFNPSLEVLIINITHTRIKMSIQYMAPRVPAKPGLGYLVIGWLCIPCTGLSRFLLMCSNIFLFMWLGMTLSAEGQGMCFSCMKELAPRLHLSHSIEVLRLALVLLFPICRSFPGVKIRISYDRYGWLPPDTTNRLLRHLWCCSFCSICWGEVAVPAERSSSHLYANIHSRLYSRAFLYRSVGLDDMFIIAGTVCITLRYSHIQI